VYRFLTGCFYSGLKFPVPNVKNFNSLVNR
ncbi:MAG: hypothetical protein ACJA0I_000756, partial [Gammaproteobacteria bacterium]